MLIIGCSDKEAYEWVKEIVLKKCRVKLTTKTSPRKLFCVQLPVESTEKTHEYYIIIPTDYFATPVRNGSTTTREGQIKFLLSDWGFITCKHPLPDKNYERIDKDEDDDGSWEAPLMPKPRPSPAGVLT